MTDETTNPWGILGNPTKEEIQKWCDMPAGEFTKHVKQTKKRLREGSKSKLFTYNVQITKIISSYYKLDVKDAIVAKNRKQAEELFRRKYYSNKGDYVFPEEPKHKDLESFSFYAY